MYYKSSRYVRPQDTAADSSEDDVDTMTRPIADKLRKPAALRKPKPTPAHITEEISQGNVKKAGVSFVTKKPESRPEGRVKSHSLEDVSREDGIDDWSKGMTL